MAKVDQEIIEAGVQLIREENIIEFNKLIRENVKVMDHASVVDHVQRLVDAGQLERAARLWMYVSSEHDATKETVRGILRVAGRVVWYIGAVGGWAYLLSWLFR